MQGPGEGKAEMEAFPDGASWLWSQPLQSGGAGQPPSHTCTHLPSGWTGLLDVLIGGGSDPFAFTLLQNISWEHGLFDT